TGGERILAILGPGSVVGEWSMIDSAPRSASVTALRDSKLSFVDRAAFETFGQSTPELYRHITTLLARRLRDTNQALVATNFLSVKGRVARALLSLAEAFGRDLGQGRILIRSESLPERPRRDGRHCAGECQPGPQRLGEPLVGEPSRGLLLPREQGRPQP